MLVVLALSAGGGVLFLFVWGRISDRQCRREWERLLGPEDELRRLKQPDDADRRLRLASLLLLTWVAGALVWSIFAA